MKFTTKINYIMLKSALKYRGFTNKELAYLTGVSTSYISQVLNKKKNMPLDLYAYFMFLLFEQLPLLEVVKNE